MTSIHFGRFIAVLIALAACCAAATADTVHLVLSADSKPYLQAAEAARRELEGAGHIVKVSPLDDIPEHRVGDRNVGYIGIGAPAIMRLRDGVPADAPLSYCMVADVDRLALGSRNATGVSTDIPVKAQFELIREALPDARRIGYLYRSSSRRGREWLDRAKRSLPDRWTIEAIDIDRFDSISDALHALLKVSPDVVWTVPDSAVFDAVMVRSLLLETIRAGIPVFGFSPQFVKAGALIGVGISPETQGRQAAEGMIRLFAARDSASESKRSDDADGPMKELVPEFEIAINEVVASRLQIEFPPGLRRRADEVFRPE